VSRFADADWWKWKRGSALFFWRWPEGDQRRYARDGMEVYITAKLPCNQRAARPPKIEKRELILDKILQVLKRGYVIIPGIANFIKNLIDYFEVPKDDDVRLVYNGTSCGLKECVWAPKFWLPTPSSAARVLGYGYYMADINLGEMFLNFPLPFVLRRFSGIDVSTFRADVNADKDLPNFGLLERAWAHWIRCWMGLKPSPYMAVHFYYLAEEFARGDRRASENSLRWDSVKLNLPGNPFYDPSQPRVMKWNVTTSFHSWGYLGFCGRPPSIRMLDRAIARGAPQYGIRELGPVRCSAPKEKRSSKPSLNRNGTRQSCQSRSCWTAMSTMTTQSCPTSDWR
jgi:hypothetical protein